MSNKQLDIRVSLTPEQAEGILYMVTRNYLPDHISARAMESAVEAFTAAVIVANAERRAKQVAPGIVAAHNGQTFKNGEQA